MGLRTCTTAINKGGHYIRVGDVLDTAHEAVVNFAANFSAQDAEVDVLVANAPSSAYTQTYSTANRTVAAATAGALTDNTTGTASTTFAAGAGVYVLPIPIGNLVTLSTGGIDVQTGIVLGHKFKILSWEFVTGTTVGTGSGAALVFNLEIGATDVGSVVSTCTVTLAGTSDIGERTAATAVAGANTGTASDTLALEVAGSGTAFTAGDGCFYIKVQNMDTADAVASYVVEHAKIVADDLDNRQTVNAIIDDLQAMGLFA